MRTAGTDDGFDVVDMVWSDRDSCNELTDGIFSPGAGVRTSIQDGQLILTGTGTELLAQHFQSTSINRDVPATTVPQEELVRAAVDDLFALAKGFTWCNSDGAPAEVCRPT